MTQTKEEDKFYTLVDKAYSNFEAKLKEFSVEKVNDLRKRLNHKERPFWWEYFGSIVRDNGDNLSTFKAIFPELKEGFSPDLEKAVREYFPKFSESLDEFDKYLPDEGRESVFCALVYCRHKKI